MNDDDFEWMRRLIKDMEPLLRQLDSSYFRETARLAQEAFRAAELPPEFLAQHAQLAKVDSLKPHLEETARQAQATFSKLGPTWFEQQAETARGLASIAPNLDDWAAMAARSRALGEESQRHWEQVGAYLREVNTAALHIDQLGRLVIDQVPVDMEEVAATLERLEAEDPETPEKFLPHLFVFLAPLESTLRLAVLVILLPLLVNLLSAEVSPIFRDWCNKLIGIGAGQVKQTVTQLAREEYQPGQLRDHRFVSGHDVNVRAGAGTQHEKIATLPMGRVVRLLGKDGAWSRIRYFDGERNLPAEGWMLSEYLEDFEDIK